MTETLSSKEKAYHEFRALLYETLGACWHTFPDKAFVESLSKENIFTTFDPVDGMDVFNQGIVNVHQWLQDICGCSLEEVQGALSLDYARLFVGPGKLLAPPWESVYCSSSGLLFQEATMEVRECYLSIGVTPSKQTPEDHIGLELAFMHLLINKFMDAETKMDREGILAMQKDFLANHLQKWVPRFCKDVADNANTIFYKGLALMTEGLVQFELGSVQGTFQGNQ